MLVSLTGETAEGALGRNGGITGTSLQNSSYPGSKVSETRYTSPSKATYLGTQPGYGSTTSICDLVQSLRLRNSLSLPSSGHPISFQYKIKGFTPGAAEPSTAASAGVNSKAGTQTWPTPEQIDFAKSGASRRTLVVRR
eukprot:638321-Rhodomonas_salina.1